MHDAAKLSRIVAERTRANGPGHSNGVHRRSVEAMSRQASAANDDDGGGDGDLDVSLSRKLSEQPDGWNVTELNLTASVVDSAIGKLPSTGLHLFSALFGGVVRSLLNRLLNKGVAFPSGILLSNTSIFAEDGFVTLAADFAFGESTKA